MSSYHVYECDRCGKTEKSCCDQITPTYWTQVTVVSYEKKTETSIYCSTCFGKISTEMQYRRSLIEQ